ncbi:MAG: hypothetical protein JOZ04_04130 [Acidimicrobiia bacterium]|nr:hypothetical protein [Acidimicrobiia bacterium]
MTVADAPPSAWGRRNLGIAVLALIVAAFSLSDCSSGNADAAVPLFVFAGQSNMVGLGSQGWPLPADLAKPSATTLFWVSQTRAWSTTPSTPGGIYGPDVSAMKALARRLGGTVLDVKLAVSGTSLAGPWDPSRPDGLYAPLKAVVADALASRLSGHGAPKVAGFFWMQGESDAQDPAAAANYAANLRRLLDQVRSDFRSPRLPIVLGRIRPYVPLATAAATAEVRAAIDGAAASTPNVRSVSTDALPMTADQYHFTGPGLVTLGDEFAAAYMSLAR